MLMLVNYKSVCRQRVLLRYLHGFEIECSYVDCQLCDICRNAEIVKCASPLSVQVLEIDYGEIDINIAQYLEQDSDKDLVDNSFGQDILSSERNLGQELLRCLRKYKLSFATLQRGRLQDTKWVIAKKAFNLCLRWFRSGHWAKHCPITENRIVRGTRLYYYFLLPLQKGDVVFHQKDFSKQSMGEALKLFG